MKSAVVRCALGALFVMLAFAFVDVGTASAGDADRAYWVGRWEKLQAKHAEVAAQLESARVEYRRGRIGNRGRGEERVELLERIERLERELADLDEQIAAFPEEARRAGALPGWFRES